MPIYEYECRKCKRRTEAIQRVGEKPLKICPHCGGELKKMASAPAIQFKGSGWYVTDYARAKTEEKSASSSKSESADKTSDAPSESTASKPAEKKKEKKASKE
jgi:putative FmdB family regulatory protein